MSRLRHSAGGFLRSLQISRTGLFVCVEGPTDRFVYDRVTAARCTPASVSYGILLAQELPLATGGKQSLLHFFCYLRRKKRLISDLRGKRTAVLFFADKDIDDVLRSRKRSSHLVYTEHYDLEGYLFSHGDLVAAAAVVSGLDEGSLRGVLHPQRDWISRAAASWSEWVVLCVVAARARASCGVTYSRPSAIHLAPYDAPDATLTATALAQLQASIAIAPPELQKLLTRTRRWVSSVFRNGEEGRLFKGKWYPKFLVADIKKIAGSRSLNQTGIETRLLDALKLTIDVRGAWTVRYDRAIRAAITALSAPPVVV